MVRLSDWTKDRLKEDILAVLYEYYPKAIATSRIAYEIRRDKEFVKRLLLDMQKAGFVDVFRKGKSGEFRRCYKWKLPKDVFLSIGGSR